MHALILTLPATPLLRAYLGTLSWYTLRCLASVHAKIKYIEGAYPSTLPTTCS